MARIAFLFAGQGAQKPGMGQSLYQMGGAPKAVFDLMEQVRPGTLDDCFDSTPERLTQTDVTQPCVYSVDLAAAMALKEAGVVAEGGAGFSLGEMAALAFFGAFSLESAARLVCTRGSLMNKAALDNPGAMAAVLKLENAVVESLCARYNGIWPVNYNCPGQLVVAGSAQELPAFYDDVKQAGGLAKPLAVGGAFHTPLMEVASQLFLAELEKAGMQQPEKPVYANYNAAAYQPPLEQTLAAQMKNPVRWSDTITNMVNDGFDTFVEVGPGKVLSGFVKRIAPQAKLLNVQDGESFEDAVAQLV